MLWKLLFVCNYGYVLCGSFFSIIPEHNISNRLKILISFPTCMCYHYQYRRPPWKPNQLCVLYCLYLPLRCITMSEVVLWRLQHIHLPNLFILHLMIVSPTRIWPPPLPHETLLLPPRLSLCLHIHHLSFMAPLYVSTNCTSRNGIKPN